MRLYVIRRPQNCALQARRAPADTHDVLEKPLRTLSIILTVFVAAGFVLFAIDETRAAANQSAAQVKGQEAATNASPSYDQERARARAHNKAREFIDDVNDVALAPFAMVSDGSDTSWVRRGIPAVIALLVYGLGLSMMARVSLGRG